MKILLIACILFSCLTSFGQEKFDHKIIVTVPGDTGLYEKVRLAMVNTDFIVKDNRNPDTLSTYVRELNVIPGYMLVKAVVSGDTVTFTGIYGLKKINDWGYVTIPKNYNQVIYYKESKTWRVLMDIATKMQGELSFSH